eukprot:6603077-Pyramimonas_sp.AAC.1
MYTAVEYTLPPLLRLALTLGIYRLPSCDWFQALEVIEAHYLYGTSYDNIDVVIHPQSIVHSMVETADSSVLAQVRLKGPAPRLSP